jgi:hypothetical protein
MNTVTSVTKQLPNAIEVSLVNATDMEEIRISATLWLQQLLIYYLCFLLPVGCGNVPPIIICTSQLDLSIAHVTYVR